MAPAFPPPENVSRAGGTGTEGRDRMPESDYRGDRAVAVISFANPPVNGLSHAVRAGISTALERAQADPSVRAIVLTGAGGLFSAGADIREFGTPASTADPTLPQLIELLET